MIPMLEDVTIVAICHHEWQELEEKHILFPWQDWWSNFHFQNPALIKLDSSMWRSTRLGQWIWKYSVPPVAGVDFPTSLRPLTFCRHQYFKKGKRILLLGIISYFFDRMSILPPLKRAQSLTGTEVTTCRKLDVFGPGMPNYLGCTLLVAWKAAFSEINTIRTSLSTHQQLSLNTMQQPLHGLLPIERMKNAQASPLSFSSISFLLFLFGTSQEQCPTYLDVRKGRPWYAKVLGM